MAEIYVVEHLLRLFGKFSVWGSVVCNSYMMYLGLHTECNVFACAVRLGAMLGFAQMDEESLTLLLSHVHDFLRYSNSLHVLS